MQAEGLFPLAGVEVVFQDYASKPYPQVGGKNGFVPHLSVLDALFNIGPEATSEMISHGTAVADVGRDGRRGQRPRRQPWRTAGDDFMKIKAYEPHF